MASVVLVLGVTGGLARQPQPIWDPRLLWATLSLIGVLLIGAIVITLVDRWRKRSNSERISASDQLAKFRSLYEAGDLTPEEFARIKGRLTDQMIQELEAQLPAADGTPPTTPEEPPRAPRD